MPAADPAVAGLLAAALPNEHTWTDRPTAADLAALPGTAAVCLLVDAGGLPIQLATTQSLKRLLVSRLTNPQRLEGGKAEPCPTARKPEPCPTVRKADLADIARGVRWRPLAAPFEGRWWYWRLARAMYPREYREMVSFGPAYFLQVDWGQPIPELRVTERVWALPGEFLGPWPSHKSCQDALQGLWDLFDLCRYPEQVRKAPHGTRCAYAEMGRCDAPCDGSVPLAAYVARCRAAWALAAGGVADWLELARARMRAAAARQQYEAAGQIKQQIQFAEKWRAEWSPIVRPLERLNHLLALPVTRRRAWKLVLFRAGQLEDGPIVTHRRVAPDGAAWLRERLAAPPELVPDVERMEQTWLFCHLRFNREWVTAIQIELPELSPPPDIEQRLVEQAAALVAPSPAERQADELAREVPEAKGDAGAAAESAGPGAPDPS
jgi:hypothetical protein